MSAGIIVHGYTANGDQLIMKDVFALMGLCIEERANSFFED